MKSTLINQETGVLNGDKMPKTRKIGIRFQLPTLTVTDLESLTKKEIVAKGENIAKAVVGGRMNTIRAFGYATRMEAFFKSIKETLKPFAVEEALKQTTTETKKRTKTTKFPQQKFGKISVSGSVGKIYNEDAIAQYLADNKDEEYDKNVSDLQDLLKKETQIKKDKVALQKLLQEQEADILASAPLDIRKPIGETISLTIR